MQPGGRRLAPVERRGCEHESEHESERADRDTDAVFVLVAPDAGDQRPRLAFARRPSSLLPLARMPPRSRAASGVLERFAAASPLSSAEVAETWPQPPSPPPDRARADPRGSRRLEIADAALSGGATRHLAALYIHVDLTTVERVRWLACFSILLYLLTAWLCRYYVAAALGSLTGLLGLAACWRPHCPAALKWVKVFVALNYLVMLALVLALVRTVAVDLPRSARSDPAARGDSQAVLILTVLVVPIAWLLHWRTQRLARLYVREFHMIEQLGAGGRWDRRSRGPARQLSSTSSLSSAASASASEAPSPR